MTASDDEDDGRCRRRRWRLLAAGWCGTLTCLASVLVLWWLADDHRPLPPPNAALSDDLPVLVPMARHGDRTGSRSLSWPADGRLARLTELVAADPDRCRRLRPHLVTVIHTARDHFVHRQLIRQAWGQLLAVRTSNGRWFRLGYVFVVGTGSTDPNGALKAEMATYGDVVQARFEDTYQNLTYKHLASLRWAWQNCPGAELILKLDDDAYLDPYAVVEWVAERAATTNRNLLACSRFPGPSAVHRRGKWALRRDQYPYRRFPAYCSGVGYLVSRDVAFDLLEAAHRAAVPFIPIDDVFVTGLLAGSLRDLTPLSLNARYVYDADRLRRWLQQDARRVCPSRFWIGDIGSEPDWPKLAPALWAQTQAAWRNHHQGLCHHINFASVTTLL